MPAAKSDQRQYILDREQFAHYVQQRLEVCIDPSTLQRVGLVLTLPAHGVLMRMNLEPMYHAYQQDPAHLDRLVETLLASLDTPRPSQELIGFDQVRSAIYPMLKPVELLVAVRESSLPMLAYQLFLADLMLTYVVENQGKLTYVNDQHLTHWHIDMRLLHTQALDNLRQRTSRLSYTTVGEGAEQVFISNHQDGYDATRLLLPDMLASWQSVLPGRIVLGIPNRDFLIAFSDSNHTTFTNIAHQIQLDRVQHTAGLTDQLFTLIDGTIQEYSWQE